MLKSNTEGNERSNRERKNLRQIRIRPSIGRRTDARIAGRNLRRLGPESCAEVRRQRLDSYGSEKTSIDQNNSKLKTGFFSASAFGRFGLFPWKQKSLFWLSSGAQVSRKSLSGKSEIEVERTALQKKLPFWKKSDRRATESSESHGARKSSTGRKVRSGKREPRLATKWADADVEAEGKTLANLMKPSPQSQYLTRLQFDVWSKFVLDDRSTIIHFSSL